MALHLHSSRQHHRPPHTRLHLVTASQCAFGSRGCRFRSAAVTSTSAALQEPSLPALNSTTAQLCARAAAAASTAAGVLESRSCSTMPSLAAAALLPVKRRRQRSSACGAAAAATAGVRSAGQPLPSCWLDAAAARRRARAAAVRLPSIVVCARCKHRRRHRPPDARCPPRQYRRTAAALSAIGAGHCVGPGAI